MPFRLLIALAVVLSGLQQPQPAFKAGVDVLRLDVTVVDDGGRPVENLRAEDFEVRVDGQPRKVTTARYYGPAPAAPAAAAAPASFATNTTSVPGRVVVLVVDLESMHPGYGKLVLDTAGRMIDTLGPSDAVGLMLIPGKGVEPTREHGRVREALAGLTGFAPKTFQRHVISISEAEAFSRMDRRIIAEVVERECRQFETACPGELRVEAQQILLEAERRIQGVVGSLSRLNARLQTLDAPKSIVLISAGLPTMADGLTHFTELQRRVAEAGTMMYVVQIEQPDTDAGSQRTAGVGSLPRADLAAGLGSVAGVSGGRLFTSVGKAAGVFERIQREITSSYQIGVELQPADADGRSHPVAVRVLRPGANSRTRRELIVSDRPRAARSPVEALAQPTDFTELPVFLSAYSTRGEDSTTLKVIMAIEAASATASSYAVTILKDDKPVFQTNGDAAHDGSDRARAVTAAQLAPGRYVLRAAVVDAAGRTGSLDTPLSVGLRPAGALQLSDLFVGTAVDRFVPASQIQAGAPISALVEIYTADPVQFQQLTVALELRRAGEDTPVATADATVSATALERRRIADGQIAAGGLAPGLYTVSAIVRQASQPVARVSRMVAVRAP